MIVNKQENIQKSLDNLYSKKQQVLWEMMSFALWNNLKELEKNNKRLINISNTINNLQKILLKLIK